MIDITSALAVDYSQTADHFEIHLGGAGTDHAITLAAGTRRVLLAPSTADILQVLQAALNAPAPALPGGVSFTVVMSATGKVKISCAGDTFHMDNAGHEFDHTLCAQVLGFDTPLTPASDSFTAALQPCYIAFFVTLYGGVWQPIRQGGMERTAGGRVYGYLSSRTSYDRVWRADLIPWNPDRASEANTIATPMYPADQYLDDLASTATIRQWSILDVLTASPNAVCGLCASNFQTVIGSTSEDFYIGQVGPGALEGIQITRRNEKHPRYVSMDLPFVLPVTGAIDDRA